MSTILNAIRDTDRIKRDSDFWNKWIKPEIAAWAAERKANEKRRREYELRRKTLRINNGSNQCLPPSAWIALAERLAN